MLDMINMDFYLIRKEIQFIFDCLLKCILWCIKKTEDASCWKICLSDLFCFSTIVIFYKMTMVVSKSRQYFRSIGRY